MKIKILLLVAVAALAVSTSAALPTFSSVSASGNAASPASLFFPADPNSQVRIVHLDYRSDTNIDVLTFSTGAGAYYSVATNATTGGGGATAVTNNISGTNGLALSSTLVLQQGGTCYPATLSSYSDSGTATNGTTITHGYYIVLGSGGWGVAQTANSDIYQMSSTTQQRYIGAGTNSLDGEALYVGNFGRPVRAQLSAANVTNSLSASGHYDSASQ